MSNEESVENRETPTTEVPTLAQLFRENEDGSVEPNSDVVERLNDLGIDVWDYGNYDYLNVTLNDNHKSFDFHLVADENLFIISRILDREHYIANADELMKNNTPLLRLVNGKYELVPLSEMGLAKQT